MLHFLGGIGPEFRFVAPVVEKEGGKIVLGFCVKAQGLIVQQFGIGGF